MSALYYLTCIVLGGFGIASGELTNVLIGFLMMVTVMMHSDNQAAIRGSKNIRLRVEAITDVSMLAKALKGYLKRPAKKVKK